MHRYRSSWGRTSSFCQTLAVGVTASSFGMSDAPARGEGVRFLGTGGGGSGRAGLGFAGRRCGWCFGCSSSPPHCGRAACSSGSYTAGGRLSRRARDMSAAPSAGRGAPHVARSGTPPDTPSSFEKSVGMRSRLSARSPSDRRRGRCRPAGGVQGARLRRPQRACLRSRACQGVCYEASALLFRCSAPAAAMT